MIRVETPQGAKSISQIEIGEKVLTHEDRWRSVTNTSEREYVGKLYAISTNKTRLACTPEQPIFVRKAMSDEPEWISAADLLPGWSIYHRGAFGFWWTPIMRIEEVRPRTPFVTIHDLEVAEDGTYTANYLAVKGA